LLEFLIIEKKAIGGVIVVIENLFSNIKLKTMVIDIFKLFF